VSALKNLILNGVLFRDESELRELVRKWDSYSGVYSKIYGVRYTRKHLETLGGKLLPAVGGICLDAGCGSGVMFQMIGERIRPAQLYAADWSPGMLEEAKIEATRLQYTCETRFRCIDLTKPLVWPDNFFDAVVSNQVISFLPHGWKEPLRELRRVLKQNGYLYLGTFLRGWAYSGFAMWKHAPAILKDPIGSARVLKYRHFAVEIDKELKKYGAEFPPREELIDFLESLGFREIKVSKTYFGYGLALRARCC